MRTLSGGRPFSLSTTCRRRPSPAQHVKPSRRQGRGAEQRFAAKGDRHKVRAQLLRPKNFHLARTRFMADPLEAAGGK